MSRWQTQTHTLRRRSLWMHLLCMSPVDYMYVNIIFKFTDEWKLSVWILLTQVAGFDWVCFPEFVPTTKIFQSLPLLTPSQSPDTTQFRAISVIKEMLAKIESHDIGTRLWYVCFHLLLLRYYRLELWMWPGIDMHTLFTAHPDDI